MTDHDLITRICAHQKRWTDMGYGFYLGEDLQTILITEVATEGDDDVLELCTACAKACGQCTPSEHPVFGETTETIVVLKRLDFTHFKELFLNLLGEIKMRGGQIV